jgi:hypothetical protein
VARFQLDAGQSVLSASGDEFLLLSDAQHLGEVNRPVHLKDGPGPVGKRRCLPIPVSVVHPKHLLAGKLNVLPPSRRGNPVERVRSFYRSPLCIENLRFRPQRIGGVSSVHTSCCGARRTRASASSRESSDTEAPSLEEKKQARLKTTLAHWRMDGELYDGRPRRWI